MQYPQYENYEPTLASWLNKRPYKWEERKLKFCVDLINEKIDANSSNIEFMGLEHIESWTGKRISDPSSQSNGVATKFSSNDVLFGKLRPYLAKVYKAENDGIATTEALILRSSNDIKPNFLKFYLLSSEFIDVVDGSTYGSKMPRANYEFIGNLSVLVPEKKEQTQIAKFLDYKTGQIDRLIEKKKALIEKLNEQRIAVITQAVTKGLNPDVPMKDSGVDWLGEIPAHWAIKRLKFCIVLKNIKIESSEIDLLYMGLENVESQTGKLIYNFDDPATSDGIGNYYEEGDILFGKLRPYLAKSYAAKSEGLCSTEFLVLKPCEYLSNYLHTLTLSDGFIKIVNSSTYGSKMPRANWDFIGNLEVPVPPQNEQEQIIQKVNQNIEKIDLMITVNNKTIDRLNEYRTALITAAVTGKIDVRQVDIPEAI